MFDLIAERELLGKLATQHRKACAQWIGSAKRAGTIDRRVRKAVLMLREGERLQ